ncbi:hypothetical protein SteCoe_28705 [Stentor coeruleus]|uniref:Uncharacterized protein n=1 Tax=Stentor coeruleus TaxID=5963 RepID=A0A1R2B7L3_9CILI|nr:hypothetical protein SteCoe_28705 [Stentor coeruleus]
MDNYSCRAFGCKNSPVFWCKCNVLAKFCRDHVSEHEDLPNPHKIEDLYMFLYPKIRQEIIAKCQETITICKKTRKQILEDSKKLIESLTKLVSSTMSNLRTTEKLLCGILHHTQISPGIVMDKSHSLAEKAIIDIFKSQDFTQAPWQIDEDTYKITLKTLKAQNNPKKATKKTLDDPNSHLNINKNLIYYIKPDSADLITVDLESFDSIKKTLNLGKIIGQKPAICPVLENHLFIYGGREHTSRSVFIINLITSEAYEKPFGTGRYSASATYFQNKVYIFGGHNGERPLNSCTSFDMNTDKWEALASMPISSISTSSGLFMGKILVTGYNCDFLYVYTPGSDSFVTCDIQYIMQSHKVVCSSKDGIYIVCSNELRISYDLKVFERIELGRKVLPEKWNLLSYPVEYKGFMYFVFGDFMLRRVNFSKKTVEDMSYVKG